MAIGMVFRMSIREGKNEEFEQTFQELAAEVRANEPGCNFYALHRSREDSQKYVVLEQYADEEALKNHGSSEGFKTISARLGPLAAGAPEVELLDAV